MNKLKLNYSSLELVAYEGAGNKTPVLDLSRVGSFSQADPRDARDYLERDLRFRLLLQERGRALQADSVMIYYPAKQANFDFVTFVGEPNSSLNSHFSQMCGNGIRSLALHILLEASDRQREKYIKKGLRIWASGEIKKVIIKSFDPSIQAGVFEVNLGPFQVGAKNLAKYVNPRAFKGASNFTSVLFTKPVPDFLKIRRFGIGFNGDLDGQPHLSLVNNVFEYQQLLKNLGIETENADLMASLQRAVCILGNVFTFDKDIFPFGINFNLAVVDQGIVYMATHEKNLSSSRESCLSQFQTSGRCKCNTLACGTGGAVTANIAYLQGLINHHEVLTIHKGGEIVYHLHPRGTLMIGSARKVSQTIGRDQTRVDRAKLIW